MKTIPKLSLFLIAMLVMAACQPIMAPEPAPPEAVAPESAPSAAPGVDLAGTNWILASLNGSPALEGVSVTLQFGADGVAAGSDGCNRYSTTFTQNGANLAFAQPGASTMMMCPEPDGVMEQASAFMAALAATTNFSANQSQLALLAGNQIIASFTADVQALAGTDWDVTMYNNGREAVVGLIEGTEFTVLFGEDGELSGSAGCNQFVGGYTVDGNTIQIGQLGTTFRFCPEPEGVMEQEQAFLAALQSAATFRVEGDQLEMRTAADAIAVMMTRRVTVDLPAPPAEPATPVGRVVGTQGLNVRSGPGTAFPIIGVARLGDEGELVGRSADGLWWAVSIPSAPGGIGWVSASFVAATNAEDVPVIAAPPPPAPTATPVPAQPTATPVPPTPTPGAQLSLWADRTNINQGECATISWSVENVQAVWVYPRGESYSRFPRAGQGSERVCPTTTTTYEMRVLQRDGSTVFREVTINVAAPAATATPVPPPPTATPAPAPNPLAGTRWDVVNYNNGRDAVVTLIEGSRIRMNFGADGQVTGNGGCNNYFASYRVNGNGINVGQPGASSLFCAEPEGVMNQEAEFLAALQSAATFSINGDTLEMRTAGDAIAIVATRAP